MNKQYLVIILIFLLSLYSCSRNDGDYKLPGVYRINVQQGNVIEQDMIDRLKPGMEKNQVRFIMGTPSLIDPFHPDRWEYIYTFTEGATQRQQRHLTIFFEDEKLAYVDGDVKIGTRKPPDELNTRSKIVDVPPWQRRRSSFVGRILDKLPVIGDKDPKPPEIEEVLENNQDQQQQPEQPEQPEQTSRTEDENPDEDQENEEVAKEEKGFFGRMLDKIPFIGDDEAEAEPQE